MKLIIIFSACLVVVHSAQISLQGSIRQNDNLDRILRQAATLLQTLPREIQEDAKLHVPELIQKYGYPAERHMVTTPDGYILEIHRIPHGKNGTFENRPVVLMVHGILASSADWVIPGPGEALPYILADLGYDVWMTNARGNRYSRNHTTLDPDRDAKEFFSFSWHEIATLDLPAIIDYTLGLTRQEKLFYIGHSRGTTVSFVLCSEKPEYNNKFRAIFSFGPGAYLKHMISPVRVIGGYLKEIELIFEILNIHEAISTNDLIASAGQIFCNDGSIFQPFCANIIFLICGFNRPQMNNTLLPIIGGHSPAGASMKQIFHFAQIYNSDIFRQWDYGRAGNLKHYGTETPPEYKFQNMKAPFEVFYSMNDWLVQEVDAKHLFSQLPNARLHLVPDSKFNHLNYIYAIDARTLLYEKVTRIMSEYLG